MKVVTSADFAPFDWEAVQTTYRGRLPHLTHPDAIYFVTFRLGDSVPLEVSRRWSEERSDWLQYNPTPWTEDIEKEYHRRFTMTMERYLDASHGSCLLRDLKLREEIIRSLYHDDGTLYELGDWVIMPNHVHVLMKPMAEKPVSTVLGPIKGASSRRINQLTNRRGSLWMDESFDHVVRSLNSLRKFQQYISNNPQKARLTEQEYTFEQRWLIQEK
ncbi:MAG: transposase [Prosthecobacter sp.]|nr:transposase [Prosthecobacter sp.]